MYSDSHPFYRWPSGVVLGALLLAASLGCGKKGDPLPPRRIIPGPTTDLSFVQQGEVLSLRMSYPATTTAGEALPGIAAVELWELVRPITDPERPPRVDTREFAVEASRQLVLEGAELTGATRGNEISARLQLAGIDHEPPRVHVFAVRSLANGGELSGFSNLVYLTPAAAPPRPARMRITPGPGGIHLTWSAPEGELEGYHVYRRLAVSGSYGEPIAFVPRERFEYLDRSSRFGDRYIYTLTSVASRDPQRESDFASEREIDYVDRFAPTPPTDLVALPEPGGARLVWQASPEGDTVGYHVYRTDPGGEPLRLTPNPRTELRFGDAGLASGLTYTYQVTAVDESGNESAPGDSAVATIP